MGSGGANEAAARPEHGGRHGAERSSLVVLPWLRGPIRRAPHRERRSRRPAVERDRTRARDRLYGLSRRRNRGAGVIKHVSGDKFGLGEPTRKVTERVQKLSALFEKSGLKAPILPEIRNDIWLKLWGNLCFNPISALTHTTLDVVATDSGTRALARHMMEEAEKISVSTSKSASMARRASARTAPQCCRTSTRAARSNSMRC